MDGLELQRRTVEVDQFHHCVARRVRVELRRGEAALDVLPALFGRGEGMVAVAHGVEQAVALFMEARQRLEHAQGAAVFQRPALYVTAARHQIEVVKLLTGVVKGGLDDGMPGVVNEHHHVRAFEGRAGAYLGAGRHALGHGALRGADEAFAAGGEIVLLQIDAGQQAIAGAGGRLPPGEDEAVRHGHAHGIAKVDAHGAVDLADALLALLQIDLRQHDAQRRGRVADERLHAVPVVRLGGKLVAGHHGPLLVIQPVRGKEDLPRGQGDVAVFHTLSLRKRGKFPLGNSPLNVLA